VKPEKRQFMQSLLDEQEAARREAILRGGGRILRRRRWRRAAGRGLAGMAVVALTVLSIQKIITPRPRAVTAAVLPRESAGSLTDAELLAKFPNTPVGLITLKNGEKRLIFPRPGDANRFMAQN
jgi:hypothetical protein